MTGIVADVTHLNGFIKQFLDDVGWRGAEILIRTVCCKLAVAVPYGLQARRPLLSIIGCGLNEI